MVLDILPSELVAPEVAALEPESAPAADPAPASHLVDATTFTATGFESYSAVPFGPFSAAESSSGARSASPPGPELDDR